MWLLGDNDLTAGFFDSRFRRRRRARDFDRHFCFQLAIAQQTQTVIGLFQDAGFAQNIGINFFYAFRDCYRR